MVEVCALLPALGRVDTKNGVGDSNGGLALYFGVLVVNPLADGRGGMLSLEVPPLVHRPRQMGGRALVGQDGGRVDVFALREVFLFQCSVVCCGRFLSRRLL